MITENIKTITLDHLKCSEPRKMGFRKNIIIQDYETSEGIVREISGPNKKPSYRLLETGDKVNVNII